MSTIAVSVIIFELVVYLQGVLSEDLRFVPFGLPEPEYCEPYSEKTRYKGR